MTIVTELEMIPSLVAQLVGEEVGMSKFHHDDADSELSRVHC